MADGTTAYVGFESERAALGYVIDGLVGGRGGMCLVEGTAGTGKSTLVQAALATSGADVEVVWGHCSAEAASEPLHLWRLLLQDLTDVTLYEGASSGFGAQARESLSDLAPDLIELLVPGVGLAIKGAALLRRHTSFGRRLLGRFGRRVADSQEGVAADRTRIEDQAIAGLVHLAKSKPLVLVLEDLHWADPASLRLLTRLHAQGGSERILTVCTSRPGGPQALRRSADLGVFDLGATLAADPDGFVRAYLASHAPGINDSFAASLRRHTGGIPLFVDRVVTHMRTHDLIVRGTDGWEVANELDWNKLPADVEGVIAEEWFGLRAELRELLTAASVEGDTFTAEVLASVTERSPLGVVRELAREEASSLFQPVGTALMAGQRVARYRFRHVLVHTWIYGQIDEIERVYLHESVGSALAALARDSAAEYAAELARHFDAAGRGEMAWSYHELAAARARGAGALSVAQEHLGRALRNAPGTPDQIRLLLESSAVAMIAGGQTEQVERWLRSVLELIEKADERSMAQRLLAGVLAELGRLDEADQLIARGLNHRPQDLELLRARQMLEHHRGDDAAALASQLKVVGLGEALPADERAEDLCQLGVKFKEQGRNEEAHHAFSESLALQQADTANWALLGHTHYALGDLLLNEERYEDARPELARAVEAWSRFDSKNPLSVAENALANLENRVGRFADALTHADAALAMTIEVVGEAHVEVAFPLTCRGEALTGLGQYQAAVSALRRALDLREAARARPGNIAWTRWLLGKTLAESGLDREEGLKLVAAARFALKALGEVTRSEVAEIESWLDAQRN